MLREFKVYAHKRVTYSIKVKASSVEDATEVVELDAFEPEDATEVTSSLWTVVAVAEEKRK